jgi:hypothetical protein
MKVQKALFQYIKVEPTHGLNKPIKEEKENTVN